MKAIKVEMTESQLSKTLNYLKIAYLLSYVLIVTLTILWDAKYILFASLMTLGLPVLCAIALPLIGFQMYRLKNRGIMIVALIYNLLPTCFILSQLRSFPFIRNLVGLFEKEPISLELSWAILISYGLFTIVAVISFYLCLKTYNLKMNKSDD